ncbi:MAG TPA: hypothetical protein VF199_08210 [Bacillales bacterium]
MGELIITAVAVLIVAIVVACVAKKMRKTGPNFQGSPPKRLGIRENSRLEPLVDRLESALNDDYMQKVKQRVLDRGNIKESEYDWYLLEMKRFLIMTALLKYVPMYNDKVDDIWHEMIMFTKEYETLCREFIGELIHHVPNLKREPNPPQRAWFDWCYSRFFDMGNETTSMYGEFYRYPLSKQLISEFRDLDEDSLVDRYFRTDVKIPETAPVIHRFIDETKQQIKESDSGRPSETVSKGHEYLPTLGLYMLYFSIVSYDDEDYTASMSQIAAGPNAGSASGGCFGGDGGSDSGSSCGASCSGGCGGGCGGGD